MLSKLPASFLLMLVASVSAFADSAQADVAFQAIADEFIASHLRFQPLSAVAFGLHEFDGKVPDYSNAAQRAELRRLKDFDSRLAGFPSRDALSSAAAFDYRVLRLAVQKAIFDFEDARMFDRNPMTYAEALDFNVYLKRNYAPLPVRLRPIIPMANATPGFLTTARDNLADPLPRPKITLAIQIAEGAAEFLANELAHAVSAAADQTLVAEFREANARAIDAFRRYAQWLRDEKLPRADDGFALGEERYRRFLARHDGITLASDRILDVGLAELKREQAAFAWAAKAVAPGKAPVDAMRELQRDHPTPESLIPETKRNLEAIRQFLVQRKIITIPSEVRVTVEETPRPQRAGSFASMDAPGPFEARDGSLLLCHASRARVVRPGKGRVARGVQSLHSGHC